MRSEVLMPLALLFIAQGVPSSAQSEPAAADPAPSTAAPPEPAAAAAAAAPGAPVFYYNLTRSFELNCTQSAADSADGYVWTVNGTALADVAALRDRAVLSQGGALLTVKAKTQEDDFGTYSCAAAGGAVLRTWDVHGIPYAKLPPNTNVVEGQKLKLVCKLFGKPYPAVSWLYTAPGGNATEVTQAPGLAERVQLAANEQGVAGAVLVLAEAAHADAGNYTCVPAGAASIAASTELRVKGMYAALWPFLGICAEVFVLCAIILVYEKRRTKPELDDSDTDNHDQKKS